MNGLPLASHRGRVARCDQGLGRGGLDTLEPDGDEFSQHLPGGQSAFISCFLKSFGLPARQQKGQFHDFGVDGGDLAGPRSGCE